jgi:peroxiredoxin Q/BCP
MLLAAIPPADLTGELRGVTFAPMKTILLKFAAFVSSGLVSICGLFAADSAKTPVVGSLAPLVEGRDQDGKTWRLTDVVGKKIVLLYFYPKDETPGCTMEACGLRDRMGDLKKDNVEVVGVSFDSADSHKKFIANHSLNFPLLADTEGRIADAYVARMAGRAMARRVSFLIGLDGKIAHVTDNPSSDVHLSEMTGAVAKLKKKNPS